MADALSPADRASLQAERGPVNMTVGGLLVFEGGPGLGLDAVRERVAARLHLVPRYRQRIEEAPLGLAHPVWVDDADFHLDWHLTPETLPDSGNAQRLADVVERSMSRRLDRSRPLWELGVIGGLEGGRAALLARMHHALVDGIGAVDIATVLLDPTPEPLDIPVPDEPWAPRPHDLGAHLARIAAAPLERAQRLVVEGATRALEADPRRAAGDLRRATALVTELARARPQAPMTALNEPISPNRAYAMARADLAELKRAGKAAGGTVNDALLAAVAGMLRIHLADALPADRSPVALVPVSVRPPGAEGGNHISTVFVDLPVHEPDPARRVAVLAETMRELRESAAVRAGALLVGATGWAPPLVSSMLVRAIGGVRAFNLVVSNVPGPQQPFYLNGARLLEAYPAVPLNPGNQGLTVGILSYDGGVHFGLLADRDLEPGVEHAAAALRAALEELRVAVL
jgi:WS/DGAT/MGAT family acyltransferase